MRAPCARLRRGVGCAGRERRRVEHTGRQVEAHGDESSSVAQPAGAGGRRTRSELAIRLSSATGGAWRSRIAANWSASGLPPRARRNSEAMPACCCGISVVGIGSRWRSRSSLGTRPSVRALRTTFSSASSASSAPRSSPCSPTGGSARASLKAFATASLARSRARDRVGERVPGDGDDRAEMALSPLGQAIGGIDPGWTHETQSSSSVARWADHLHVAVDGDQAEAVARGKAGRPSVQLEHQRDLVVALNGEGVTSRWGLRTMASSVGAGGGVARGGSDLTLLRP